MRRRGDLPAHMSGMNTTATSTAWRPRRFHGESDLPWFVYRPAQDVQDRYHVGPDGMVVLFETEPEACDRADRLNTDNGWREYWHHALAQFASLGRRTMQVHPGERLVGDRVLGQVNHPTCSDVVIASRPTRRHEPASGTQVRVTIDNAGAGESFWFDPRARLRIIRTGHPETGQ